MSGKQARRRRSAHQIARVEEREISLDDALTVERMTPAQARELAEWRMDRNEEATGHPLHHRTVSGVIVDTDPTLEQWLAKAGMDAPTDRYPEAKPAVPVNRHYYDTPEGQAVLAQWVVRMEHPDRLYLVSREGKHDFWPQVQVHLQKRTAERNPADREADARVATLVKTLTPEERARDVATATDILQQREEAPDRVFLAVARVASRDIPMDDPSVVAAIQAIGHRHGRETVEAHVYEGLSEAQAMDIYRLICQIDLSEFGVN